MQTQRGTLRLGTRLRYLVLQRPRRLSKREGGGGGGGGQISVKESAGSVEVLVYFGHFKFSIIKYLEHDYFAS